MLENLILGALAPVYVGMAAGYIAGKCGIVGNSNVKDLNALVLSVAAPVAVFVGVANMPKNQFLVEGHILLIVVPVLLATYWCWYAAARLWGKLDAKAAAVEALAVAFPNFAAAGFTVFGALFGERGTVPVAVSLAAGSMALAFVTLFILESSDAAAQGGSGGAAMVRKAFVRAALKPLVLAPVIGAAVSISGLTLPDVSFAALKPIGQIANGGALFLTGLVISAQAIDLSWRILAAVLAINVLRPLAVLAFPQVASIPAETTQAALLLCALPAGFFGVLFAVSYRVPARASATIVLGSTLASILTLSLAIAGTLRVTP